MPDKPDPNTAANVDSLSGYSYAREKYGNASEILAKSEDLGTDSMMQAAREILPVSKSFLPQDLHVHHEWIWKKLRSAEAEEGQGTLRSSCEAMDLVTKREVEQRIQHVFASLNNRASGAAEP